MFPEPLRSVRNRSESGHGVARCDVPVGATSSDPCAGAARLRGGTFTGGGGSIGGGLGGQSGGRIGGTPGNGSGGGSAGGLGIWASVTVFRYALVW